MRRRISCKSIGQAASAQVVSCALSMAEARYLLRREGVMVVNLHATNSVNLCALALADTSKFDETLPFGITSTVRLVYNSCPVKVSSASVLSACTDLARRELSEHLISNAMGTHNHMLRDICMSIVGELTLDPVWCSWVLLVYLSSHPRGRDILRTTGLTDIDIQSAIAFERYGSEEIRRRARQRREKDKTPAQAQPDSVLAQKRKRNARGTSSTGMSDAHLLLEFWHQAFQSEDSPVLLTLAAHSKRTVRDAAMCTLARQAEGTDVADNTVLQSMSMNNALKSAQALVSFVGRRGCEAPGIAILRARDKMELSLIHI